MDEETPLRPESKTLREGLSQSIEALRAELIKTQALAGIRIEYVRGEPTIKFPHPIAFQLQQEIVAELNALLDTILQARLLAATKAIEATAVAEKTRLATPPIKK